MPTARNTARSISISRLTRLLDQIIALEAEVRELELKRGNAVSG
jgi:hypothetical protein